MDFALASRPARLSRSTAVPLSGISGSFRSSMRSSISCHRRWTGQSKIPLEGLRPDTGEAVSRRAVQEEPFSGIVFKTLIDPFVGRLSYLRVLSGALHADSTGLQQFSGQQREKRTSLYAVGEETYGPCLRPDAGEIVAIGKLKDTQTGDTLCDEQYSHLLSKDGASAACAVLCDRAEVQRRYRENQSWAA